jgi:hypothetical protein
VDRTGIEPVMALRKLVNGRGWSPAPRLSDESRYEQAIAADTRDGVFIVNDGGAIHNVAAAEVERLLEQPGWRLAVDEEIKRWYDRQGLKG